jgi:hypothetical protein
MIANILISLLLGANAVPAPTPAEEVAEIQLRFLASSLDTPVNIREKENTLGLLLTDLADQASDGKDPKKKLTLSLHWAEFALEAGGRFEPEVFQIRFATPLQGIPLRNVLALICEQLPGVGGFVVRKGYIELAPCDKLRKELNHPYGLNHDFTGLVVRIYENVTAETAFKHLGEKYNRTIALSGLAEKPLKTTISARLVNVPFETAVETLADMVDLKVVRKKNVLIVTTREQAADLSAEEEKRLNGEKKFFQEHPPKPVPVSSPGLPYIHGFNILLPKDSWVKRLH